MTLGQHISFVVAFADESYEDVAVVQAHHHAAGRDVLGDAIRSCIPARVDAHVDRSPFPVRCWEGPLPGDENSLDAMPLLLREEDVARVLQMDRVIAAVEEAFRLVGRKRATTPPRQRSTTAGTTLHVMSAAIPPFHVMGLKAYTSARSATRFIGMLYDTETSELLARIEANRLGQMRTGAASAVATKHMARPDAGSGGIIGTGWQARSQVLAISRVRPVALVKCHSRHAPHLAAVDAGALAWERVVELGQIVNGTVQGRVSPREITLFESQGIALEDVATMKLAYETALAMGVGEQLKKDGD